MYVILEQHIGKSNKKLVDHLWQSVEEPSLVIAETVKVRWLGVKLYGVTRIWKTHACQLVFLGLLVAQILPRQ